MGPSLRRNIWNKKAVTLLLCVIIGCAFTACKDSPEQTQSSTSSASSEASQSEATSQESSSAVMETSSDVAESSSSTDMDEAASENSSSQMGAGSEAEQAVQTDAMIEDDGTTAISVVVEVEGMPTKVPQAETDAIPEDRPDRIIPPPMLPVGWELLYPEEAQRHAELLAEHEQAKNAAEQAQTELAVPNTSEEVDSSGTVKPTRILPPPMKPVGWELVHGNTPYTEGN